MPTSDPRPLQPLYQPFVSAVVSGLNLLSLTLYILLTRSHSLIIRKRKFLIGVSISKCDYFFLIKLCSFVAKYTMKKLIGLLEKHINTKLHIQDSEIKELINT